MQKYLFTDQTGIRTVTATVDEHVQVQHLIPQVIPHMKLPRVDMRGVELVYLLAYKGRFLNSLETLASAGIPSMERIDVVGIAVDLGSGRHSREWEDYEALLQLQDLNRHVFDLALLGEAYDGAPLGYRLTFKGIAGPVVDETRVRETTAPVKLDGAGKPVLADRFTVEIFMPDGYPFTEPQCFYRDPVLCHPNVNPYGQNACLFQPWRAINSLVDCVERLIVQIGYLGFTPTVFDTDDGCTHLLNDEALQWIKRYLADSDEGIPFRNPTGQAPPALTKPPALVVEPSVPAFHVEVTLVSP